MIALTPETIKLILYIGGPILALLFVYLKGKSHGIREARQDIEQNSLEVAKNIRKAEAENQSKGFERQKDANKLAALSLDALIRVFNSRWGRPTNSPAADKPASKTD